MEFQLTAHGATRTLDMSVNVQRTTTTTQIFDKFYNSEVVVETNQYDYVYSFFKNIMMNDKLAQEFTAQVFIMSQTTGVSATEYVESVRGQNAQTLTMSMAYYLNQTRSNSTLLGVGSVATPNYYAARNILP
jgi:hypothetical protein